jgi:hypothetical protein
LSCRAEIDGLRAIAVVSVFLYHTQLVIFVRDLFEGGFIGADIFYADDNYPSAKVSEMIVQLIMEQIEKAETNLKKNK